MSGGVHDLGPFELALAGIVYAWRQKHPEADAAEIALRLITIAAAVAVSGVEPEKLDRAVKTLQGELGFAVDTLVAEGETPLPGLFDAAQVIGDGSDQAREPGWQARRMVAMGIDIGTKPSETRCMIVPASASVDDFVTSWLAASVRDASSRWPSATILQFPGGRTGREGRGLPSPQASGDEGGGDA